VSSDRGAAEAEVRKGKREKVALWSGAIFYFIAGITLVFFTIGGFYGLRLTQQIADIQQANRALTSASSANTKLLVECTTPPAARKPPIEHPLKDDCYIRSQQQSAGAINDISAITVAAAACGASHPGDVDGTRACVERELAANK
jgi:hypothetical protein